MAVSNAFGSHELLCFDYAAAVAAGASFEAELDANVLAAIDNHGFAVIEHALPGSVCDELLTEMRPYIDATPHGLHGLGGTRRVGALVARSPIDGKVRKGGKGFRYPWHLHLTQIIDLGPRGGTQEMPHQLRLHRANGMWVHDFQDAGIDMQLEVMWALSDFTTENGATHVVLGSHRDQPRGGTLGYSQPTIQATMSQGSALIWTGWSIHGAGVNRSTERRVGMNINYALGFLAQEENQYLACPPHLARNLPQKMQDLIGYRQPAASLNYVAECQSPADSVLKQDYDVLVPGAHGHKMNPATDDPGLASESQAEFEGRLARLEAQKVLAIEKDDLELALQLKKAISVLKRSAR